MGVGGGGGAAARSCVAPRVRGVVGVSAERVEVHAQAGAVGRVVVAPQGKEPVVGTGELKYPGGNVFVVRSVLDVVDLLHAPGISGVVVPRARVLFLDWISVVDDELMRRPGVGVEDMVCMSAAFMELFDRFGEGVKTVEPPVPKNVHGREGAPELTALMAVTNVPVVSVVVDEVDMFVDVACAPERALDGALWDVHEILTTRALERVDEFKSACRAWFAEEFKARSTGKKGRVRKPRPVIMAERDWCLPAARGLNFDSSQWPVCKVIGNAAVAGSEGAGLNARALAAMGRSVGSRDERLLAQLEAGQGIDLEAHSASRVMLLVPPHNSGVEFAELITCDIRKRVAQRLASAHVHPPYIPVRSIPVAGVSKDGDNVRVVSDLSCSPGEDGVDMNSAIDKTRLPALSWPSYADAVQDSHVLSQVAGDGLDGLAGAVWDVGKAYRMLRLRRKFCWMQQYWFADSWFGEERGSFGSAALPHLYMGHASLILEIVRTFMDALERAEPLSDVRSDRVQRWLAARSALPAAQQRLWSISVFTDDNLPLAVGIRRCTRLCMILWVVHRRAALDLQKGQGPSLRGVVFLGGGLSFVHGATFVKEERRLELIGRISDLVPTRNCRGKLVCREKLRCTVAKLNFTAPCFDRSRHLLGEGFFWSHCKALPLRLAHGFVPISVALERNLFEFQDRLRQRDTLSFADSVSGGRRLPGAKGAPAFVGLADAAGEAGVGLGFWLPDGRHCFVPTTARHRRWLGICALEAAANVLVKLVLVRGGQVGLSRVGCDNEGWSIISAFGRARTAACRYWLTRMLQVESWCPAARFVDVWLYGEDNVLADAASRRKMAVLLQYAREHGLQLTEVVAPVDIHVWLEEAVLAAQVEFAACGLRVDRDGYPGVQGGGLSRDDALPADAWAAVAVGRLEAAQLAPTEA